MYFFCDVGRRFRVEELSGCRQQADGDIVSHGLVALGAAQEV